MSCLLALAAFPAAAGAQLPDQPVVVTTGEAVVRAAPDQAFVNVQVQSRADAPQEAQRLNAQAMTAVQEQLRAAGVPADAIETVSYSLEPEYDFKDGSRTLRGYLATNAIEVRLDDLTRVGEVTQIAVQGGATSIGGIRFDLKDRDALEREALKLAVADAYARAEAAASGANRSIARVLKIEESGGMPPPRPMMAMRAESAADAGPAPPIQAGEIEIRAQVTVTAILN